MISTYLSIRIFAPGAENAEFSGGQWIPESRLNGLPVPQNKDMKVQRWDGILGWISFKRENMP